MHSHLWQRCRHSHPQDQVPFHQMSSSGGHPDTYTSLLLSLYASNKSWFNWSPKLWRQVLEMNAILLQHTWIFTLINSGTSRKFCLRWISKTTCQANFITIFIIATLELIHGFLITSAPVYTPSAVSRSLIDSQCQCFIHAHCTMACLK